MLFESLSHSADAGELILVDGGYCRFHLRQDRQLTLYEILVLPADRGRGIGTALLQRLLDLRPACIVARCPADLPANRWYASRGFGLAGTEETRTGRALNVWRRQP